MAFIRIKTISGKPYAYLVESIKTSKGPRQKVKKYLGRVYEFETKKSPPFKSNNLVHNLILAELSQYGFEKHKDNYIKDNITFNPKNNTITKSKKDAIIKLQEGYLSSFTIKRITNFKKGKNLNKDAFLLAKYFLEAGLNISQEEFIEFYSGV